MDAYPIPFNLSNLCLSYRNPVKKKPKKKLAISNGILAKNAEEAFVQLWEHITPKLESALRLHDQHQDLPDSAWLSRDKKSNQQAIDSLLDETVDILAISHTQGFRQRILKLQQQIQQDKNDIETLQKKKVTAAKPEDYVKKIEEIQHKISQQQKEIEWLKQQYSKELSGIGLTLDQEQLDFLLSIIVGDDVIKINIAFHNVKILTEKLENLTNESGEEIEIARKYYGMYTVLLRVLNSLYNQVIAEIDQTYFPKIQNLMQRAEQLLEQTRAIKRTKDNREVLSANMRAQKLTMQAAKAYYNYLVMQRNDVIKVRDKLELDLQTANNTYATVQICGELLGMMRFAPQLCGTLVEPKLPVLRTFENYELQNEFAKLTQKLIQS